MKEPYVKPEVKSEVLEPEALTGGGSGMQIGGGGKCSPPDGCSDGICG